MSSFILAQLTRKLLIIRYNLLFRYWSGWFRNIWKIQYRPVKSITYTKLHELVLNQKLISTSCYLFLGSCYLHLGRFSVNGYPYVGHLAAKFWLDSVRRMLNFRQVYTVSEKYVFQLNPFGMIHVIMLNVLLLNH